MSPASLRLLYLMFLPLWLHRLTLVPLAHCAPSSTWNVLTLVGAFVDLGQRVTFY